MKAERDECARLARRLLAEHPVVDDLTLRVQRCIVRVAASDARIVSGLRAYYAPFLIDSAHAHIDVVAVQTAAVLPDTPLAAYPPGPGKTRVKDEFADFPSGRILRKRLTAMLFLFGDEFNVTAGPCLENLNQVVNFINNRYVQWQVDRGALLCHAAGVARAGRGVLIAGMAGRGKSTLALHLLARGLDYVSNDRVLIRRAAGHTEMLGLPKLPRVNPGTILNNARLTPMLSAEEEAQFRRLTPEELWQLEQKYDVDVAGHFGGERFAPAASLAGLVVLTWKHGQGAARAARVPLHERPELLAAIMKPLGVHYRPPPGGTVPDGTPAEYLEYLQGIPVVEVGGGVDFAEAGQACVQLLER